MWTSYQSAQPSLTRPICSVSVRQRVGLEPYGGRWSAARTMTTTAPAGRGRSRHARVSCGPAPLGRVAAGARQVATTQRRQELWRVFDNTLLQTLCSGGFIIYSYLLFMDANVLTCCFFNSLHFIVGFILSFLALDFSGSHDAGPEFAFGFTRKHVMTINCSKLKPASVLVL